MEKKRQRNFDKYHTFAFKWAIRPAPLSLQGKEIKFTSSDVSVTGDSIG